MEEEEELSAHVLPGVGLELVAGIEPFLAQDTREKPVVGPVSGLQTQLNERRENSGVQLEENTASFLRKYLF